MYVCGDDDDSAIRMQDDEGKRGNYILKKNQG